LFYNVPLAKLFATAIERSNKNKNKNKNKIEQRPKIWEE
jgi:hypothetical protein